MNASPQVPGRLVGRAVAITRAVENEDRWVSALEREGARVVSCPLLVIVEVPGIDEDLRHRLGGLSDQDRVVVTSVNGARCLARCLSGVESFDARVVVVGSATAAPLAGVVAAEAILTATEPRAEGVVAAIGPGRGRALVLRGDRARPTVAEGLGAAGWQVEDLVVYRSVSRRPDTSELDAALACDVVVVTSGSTAQAWAGLLEGRRGPAVVVIGPVTRRDAEATGLRVAAEAVEPSPEGVIAAIVAIDPSDRDP